MAWRRRNMMAPRSLSLIRSLAIAAPTTKELKVIVIILFRDRNPVLVSRHICTTYVQICRNRTSPSFKRGSLFCFRLLPYRVGWERLRMSDIDWVLLPLDHTRLRMKQPCLIRRGNNRSGRDSDHLISRHVCTTYTLAFSVYRHCLSLFVFFWH